MKRSEINKQLDQIILQAAPFDKPVPNFEKWCREHPEAIRILKARGEQYVSASGRAVKTIRIKTIIKSKVAKLAMAAAVIIIAAISTIFTNRSVVHAYHIEQTIEAYFTVRYLHFKYFYKSYDEAARELWIEYDNTGKVKNMRSESAGWLCNGQIMVWKEDKVQIWDREQSTFSTFKDEVYTASVFTDARRYDPKLAVEFLYERQAKGEVKVEISEPSNETDPIIVTGTYLPNTYKLEGLSPQMCEVFYVDRDTRLVSAIEVYRLKESEDKYEYLGVYEYQDYNQPFDAAIFELEEEVPSDVMRIEEYNGYDIGLEQGDLDEKEIAVKVVNEFFEALVSRDYARAGKLFGGMPVGEAQDKFGKLNTVKILSVGEPVKHSKPSSYRVPCTVEIEVNGKVETWQPNGPFVRQVYRRPHHWRIIGGLER